MWCPDDKNIFMNNTTGQITPYDLVGKIIIDYVKQNDLKNIVEIGTWNGLGSTRCFLLALQGNSTTNFFTLETNEEKVQIAKNNLISLISKNCNFLWGSILKSSDIQNIEQIFPELITNSEFRRWNSLDIQNINLSPNVLDKIPDTIDFLLLDGGEFTTYYEFLILFPRCTKFIALDDVNVSKCREIRRILQLDPNWEEICHIHERNGFSLFQIRLHV
jgi:hypothetical protein